MVEIAPAPAQPLLVWVYARQVDRLRIRSDRKEHSDCEVPLAQIYNKFVRSELRAADLEEGLELSSKAEEWGRAVPPLGWTCHRDCCCQADELAILDVCLAKAAEGCVRLLAVHTIPQGAFAFRRLLGNSLP